jgi:hypothetical protein
MHSSLFLKRISPSATPTALASSGVPTLRHSDTEPLRSSNSFVSYHIPLSPVSSSDCALFSVMARAQLLSFQKLAHSFYRDGGGTPSLGAFKLSLLLPLCFHNVTNCFSRKPLVFTTYKMPRGGGPNSAVFFAGSRLVQSQIPIPSAGPASDQSSPPATPGQRKPRRPPAATTSPRPAA